MKNKLIIIFLGLFLIQNTAQAAYPILRPYQSARAAGMGNVRYTTGLYEENFFANPARATKNPAWRIQWFPKILLETGTGTLDAASNLSGGGLSAVSGVLGKPISTKLQMVFPAYYSPNFIDDSFAFAAGMHMNLQSVILASNTGNIDPTLMITAGPSFTVARRFMEFEELAVGLNFHSFFKGSSSNAFGLKDYLSGSGFASSLRGGTSAGFDLDLGATYDFDWTWLGFDYSVSAAVNNIMGGNYNQVKLNLSGWGTSSKPFYRTYNAGFKMEQPDFWIFDNFLLAFESTDIGALQGGSIFKTLHFGTEATWSAFAFRGGINQGYLCGGLGFDVGFVDLSLATYAEELGLNAGTFEDRRYVFELGIQL